MDHKVIIKTRAEQDITEAAEWYHTRAFHLTHQFIEEINKSILLLQENPEHYQKRYNEVRVLFIENFPYGIYYTIEDKTVFIHAILHSKRDPKAGIERT